MCAQADDTGKTITATIKYKEGYGGAAKGDLTDAALALARYRNSKLIETAWARTADLPGSITGSIARGESEDIVVGYLWNRETLTPLCHSLKLE